MSYTCNNPLELKDAILRRLGAPIVHVEVTEEQVFDCISRALELYGEYHYDGFHRTYATVVLTEQQAKTGIIDMKGGNVFAVTQVLRTNVGSIITMDGTAVYPWFTDFVMGMTGASIGGQCKWYGPNAFGGDLGYFTQLMSYRSMMGDLLSPLPDFYYNSSSEMMKIAGQFKAGDLIVFEVYCKSYANVDTMLAGTSAGYGFAMSCDGDEPSQSQLYGNPNLAGGAIYAGGSNGMLKDGAYNNRWVKDMSTAYVKELNGQVLAKHQGMQLPGGITIDGVRLIEEARIDIDKLRNELELLDAPPPIIMG
ncbi:gp13 neck protein [Aeromonas phage 31]|uniref:Neck protein n=4 Tax=Biquartavirus TaxID=1912143 RepID=Q6U9F3_9CAUD|nr:head-tail adaptor Ad2 [Aeromonas phage 44RR2.8t]YP_238876.1 head-tail adaptor Ad2 [Aeromonas phage 31]APU00621.1 head completion, neck hetero-dimeric protein [Aeromonas phage 44RR2.8t.2]APU01041.1 head completion, neck hetero-dimeric protein [Aeromonas phage 31.2]APU01951.1 head completion, neck hetero-dimeric protein [Aeromonas phage L9-6]APU02449.1 head completion, neck hetero-dimeric protein [Aeromonas phage SW69-9]UYD59704.1 neck protein [Aeromonas phage avDM5]UYD60566.1 neck protein 